MWLLWCAYFSFVLNTLAWGSRSCCWDKIREAKPGKGARLKIGGAIILCQECCSLRELSQRSWEHLALDPIIFAQRKRLCCLFALLPFSFLNSEKGPLSRFCGPTFSTQSCSCPVYRWQASIKFIRSPLNEVAGRTFRKA